MAIVKNVRASDQILPKDMENAGFVIRKRTPIQQITRMLGMLVVITAGVALLVYYDTLTGCFMCVGLGLVVLAIAIPLENLKKLMQTTEFMNALFSSALAKKFKFCTVVRTNGTIVYLSRPFQELFATFMQQPKRDLETLFELYHVSAEHRAAVNALVSEGKEGSVAIIIENSSDKSLQPMMISVEPIDRPTGFVLLRGL